MLSVELVSLPPTPVKMSVSPFFGASLRSQFAALSQSPAAGPFQVSVVGTHRGSSSSTRGREDLLRRVEIDNRSLNTREPRRRRTDFSQLSIGKNLLRDKG